MPKSKYEFVSIGDCTIDAFIEVEESATVEYDQKHENPKLCFNFGDKLPYESLQQLPAGNCNNAAVGAARLGLKSAFYGIVGNDHNSHIILNNLRQEKVSEEFMVVQKGMQTNYHFVLWHKGERTILIKHQQYKYTLPRGIEKSAWIYLSSIGVNGLKINPAIAKMLKSHPKMKMAFNPGTFQLRMGAKKLLPLLKRTEILFLNKEESEMMLEKPVDTPIPELLQGLKELGPNIVVITDGLKGSYCLDHGVIYHIGLYPHKPFEVTGCGDAYSTAFTAAIIKGLPVTEAMRWGTRNGASVALKIGPQPGLMRAKDIIRDLKAHPEVKPLIIK